MAAAAILARGPSLPPAEDLARVAQLLAAHPWVFARTMADNPHWYTLRKNWVDDDDFVFVVQFIRRWGYVERFPDPKRGWPYILLGVDSFKYWTMGDPCEPGPYNPSGQDCTILINRKPLP
jgi:hypothetical protein